MALITIIGGIAMASWLLVVAAIAFIVMRISRGQKYNSGIVFLVVAIVLAIVLNTVSAGLVFVEPQKRGVVLTVASGGIKNTPLQPGLNWVIPYAETVLHYDVSKQTYTMSIAHAEGAVIGDDSIQALTKDGQNVLVDASIIFKVDPDKVVQVHKEWQSNYVDNMVRPLARGVIRDWVSVYDVAQVYSENRADLITGITEELELAFIENGLILESFILRNISFTAEYAKSVEDKHIAEQLVLQKQFEVQQAEMDAQQALKVAEGEANALLEIASANAEARLIEAEAEAEALIMLADAIRDNPEVLTLEYIQQLAPNIDVMLLPADSPFLFPLPEMQPEATPVVVP